MADHSADEAVSNAEIREWLKTRVASEIDDLKDSEISAEHVSEGQRAVLAWFVEHYVNDDPTLLRFPDGSGDGGMDIVSITTSDQRNHVTIFQCSAPRPDQIAQGHLSTTKTKFADDVRHLRHTLDGSARKLKSLNSTAQGVLREINKMRELAGQEDDPIPVTIEIRPLALRPVHPDVQREFAVLRQEASSDWSSTNEQWLLHDVQGIESLYQHYLRRRGKETSPEELKLTLCSGLSRDHSERGPFLCFVKAYDLVHAYDDWGAGLLDSNLRYALGKSEVNKLIENELEHLGAIKRFHEKNNGVVLTCDSCHESRGQIRLIRPQIVNGGQTVHSISTVLREIETLPLESRDKDAKQVLKGIRDELKLSIRVVVVSGAKATRADEIAMASNTQNRLSERTMRSSSLQMRDLRLKLSAAMKPWYVVTKDGEWSSVSKNSRLLQSRTGNRQLTDFKYGRRFRVAENTDLGVAMMAFLGFVADAKPSRIFKPRYFDSLFDARPSLDAWSSLTTRRVEWLGEPYRRLFEPPQCEAHQWLVAYFLFDFWRTFTFPESKQLLLAFEERGDRDSDFRSTYLKASGWDVPEEVQAEVLKSLDTCFWREQVAKSAYLVLVYQSMRILAKVFGSLDDATCRKILHLKQFTQIFEGASIDGLGDFRKGSFGDGPLTSIGRILLHSCEMLWQNYDARIRPMTSRQQTLLQEEWVARLGEQVDRVCDRLAQPAFRQILEGPSSDLEIKTIADLFRA